MYQIEAMYQIAHAFASTDQDLVQEVAHLCSPELSLRRLPPSVLNFKINTLSKRLRMLKLEKNAELSENSDKIFKSGNLDYYMMRPKQNDIKNICFAMLASYCFKFGKDENDYQSL